MMMRFGLVLPARGPLCTSEHLMAAARFAEDGGFSSAWVTDHIAFPRQYNTAYPYASDGKVRGDVHPDAPWIEATVAMTWILSATTELVVGSAVVVALYRSPLLLAKQLSSMAFLAGADRLCVGLGAGWLLEEFEALGMPHDNRGRRFEETVRIMRWAWDGAPTAFQGDFWDLPAMHFAPAAKVPLIVGGHSKAALRRVAELGDGWLPSHLSPNEVAEGVDTIMSMRKTTGRTDQELRVVARPGEQAELTRELLDAYRVAGVTDLIVEVPYHRATWSEIEAKLRRLRETVMMFQDDQLTRGVR